MCLDPQCRLPQPFPRLRSHGDAFAGLEPFEQLCFKALLFKALEVLTNELPDIVTRRTEVRLQRAFFDELFEIFHTPSHFVVRPGSFHTTLDISRTSPHSPSRARTT